MSAGHEISSPPRSPSMLPPSPVRRCSMTSTTVIMTNNVINLEKMSMNCNTEEVIRKNGNARRRLSKQNATIEEPTSSEDSHHPSAPLSENPNLELKKSNAILKSSTIGGDDTNQRQRLQREDAVVDDDDTKLRPPSLNRKSSWSLTKSQSRESTGTDYSDRIGTDLRQFIIRTLHKSEEDRKQMLEFEKEMIELIENLELQSKKFILPSSYHRMLLHRCAAWFGLDHNVTNKQTEIVVNKSEKTKIPDEKFMDHIVNDVFLEPNFQPKKSNKHHGSLNEVETIEIGRLENQNSLNNDILITRQTQSFDIPPKSHQISSTVSHNFPPSIPQHHSIRCVPMRQLSLQCSQKYVTPPPPPTHWAAGHSVGFDTSQQNQRGGTFYYASSPRRGQNTTSMMRKAESFGGIEFGYVEAPSYVCHTPPVMIHAKNEYAAFHPQFDEAYISSSQPIYQEQHILCPASIPHFEYQQQPVCIKQVKMIPECQLRIPATQHSNPTANPTHYFYAPNNAQPVSTNSGPTQFISYNQFVEVQPTLAQVDHIVEQPFPTVGHFTVTAPISSGVAESQTAANSTSSEVSNSHQSQTASKFIKASIDGGYGSMNQEADSSKEFEPPGEDN